MSSEAIKYIQEMRARNMEALNRGKKAEFEEDPTGYLYKTIEKYEERITDLEDMVFKLARHIEDTDKVKML
tara:strand:- start:649 stop:861 length:213 start_codon:yes stop_codon:yes gene_type:complete